MPALREIKFLRELRHDNVIELLDVFQHSGKIHLVFPLMHSDLDNLIKDKQRSLGQAQIKGCMQMILAGVGFLHENWILHRDLKPDNFLLAADGTLKVTDFGLSKSYGTQPQRMTTRVTTLYYKCPELLLGADSYGPEIDAWSCGCVFAEMMLRRPFLAGRGENEHAAEIDQLNAIVTTIGLPPPIYKVRCTSAQVQAATRMHRAPID